MEGVDSYLFVYGKGDKESIWGGLLTKGKNWVSKLITYKKEYIFLKTQLQPTTNYKKDCRMDNGDP